MMAGEVVMPQRKRAKTPSQPRRKTAKTSVRRKRAAPAEENAQPPADPRFVRDVIVRGEAASLAPSGKLPADATHVITGGAADTATIKRARFKTF
jgi:hypothetical protein